jgi:hypothetical protein
VDATKTHICKACSNEFAGKFCNNCGEKIYNEHDKKLSHIFEEAFHFITHLDNKFLKTLRFIFFKPGFVSKEYCEGKRKKYFKPVSLFLIAVIIYLLFPLLQGMNISFANHIHNNQRLGINYSKTWAIKKMQQKNFDEFQLAEKFDHKSPKFAKVFLLLLLPLTALALAVIFRRKKVYFFDHFILATELNTVFLLLFFLLLPVLIILSSYLSGIRLGYGDSPVYTSLQFLLFTTVLITAFKRFYSVSFLKALLSALLFILLYVIVIFIYRQLVFTIVMLTI